MYLQKMNLSCQHITKASTYITVHYRNDIHALGRCMDSVLLKTLTRRECPLEYASLIPHGLSRGTITYGKTWRDSDAM
jgi:hypothetical protein